MHLISEINGVPGLIFCLALIAAWAVIQAVLVISKNREERQRDERFRRAHPEQYH